MNKHQYIYLFLIGLLGFLSSCEEDGSKIYMLTDPIEPTITVVPDLTLQRNNGNDTLVFACTPVNPGFTASANYFLEACASGDDFNNTISLVSDVQADVMKITVSNFNGAMLKKFPADQLTSIDLRLRSVLVVDAGTGALGTSANPFEYISSTVSADVTTYGLPRLNLTNSGMDQKIESALGDGSYSGFVKLDVTMPFTLSDPDAGIEYGASGSALVINGDGINTPDTGDGWYILTANTEALSYSFEQYMIGLVGSATPNGWDAPDQKLDYDATSGTWSITINLIDGEIKFRKNDGWAWNIGGSPDNLTQGGDNIVVTAGNYTITLTIINDATGTCTIVKN